MQSFQVELLGCKAVAGGTMEFKFSKPAQFNFVAGQAVDLLLAGDGDAAVGQDLRHSFSLVSAPQEQVLRIAFRVRDSTYKKSLLSLPLGSLLQIEGPFGQLTLDKDAQRPAVMLAGGIGITPFISILQQARFEHSEQQMVLLYANRNRQEAAYLQQLEELEQQLAGFSLHATMTAADALASGWDGDTGRFTEQMIRQYTSELNNPVFYLCGPPLLVESVYDLLEDMGVDEEDIRVESFGGYA